MLSSSPTQHGRTANDGRQRDHRSSSRRYLESLPAGKRGLLLPVLAPVWLGLHQQVPENIPRKLRQDSLRVSSVDLLELAVTWACTGMKPGSKETRRAEDNERSRDREVEGDRDRDGRREKERERGRGREREEREKRRRRDRSSSEDSSASESASSEEEERRSSKGKSKKRRCGGHTPLLCAKFHHSKECHAVTGTSMPGLVTTD